MKAISSPPTAAAAPTPPGLPVSHSELVTAVPSGLLLLPVFVKHNHWLAQLTKPLTTAAVSCATVLFVTTLSTQRRGAGGVALTRLGVKT